MSVDFNLNNTSAHYRVILDDEINTSTGSWGNWSGFGTLFYRNFDPGIALLIHWTGGVGPSDAEAQELYKNPWQIFEPEKQYIFTEEQKRC